MALVAVVLTWFWLPEPPHGKQAPRHAPWTEFRLVASKPGVAPLLGLDLGYWSAFALYQTTFALFVSRRFGFDAAATGHTLAVMGLVNITIQLGVVGRAAKKFGERRTLLAGFTCGAVGLSGMSLAHQVPLFLPFLVLAACGSALSSPSLSSLLSQTVPSNEQGRLQGVSGSMESLGRTIGPLWGSSVLAAFGEGAAYGSAALVLVLVGLWLTRLEPQPAPDQTAAT
jgi:DHA1 family tetracycline resistance protein-like MFS transporter